MVNMVGGEASFTSQSAANHAKDRPRLQGHAWFVTTLISHQQVICAAFESGLKGESGRLQDLVHAAWGVYTTGGGEEDALDSLVRIARLAVRPFLP